jgi:hypothetical protein
VWSEGPHRAIQDTKEEVMGRMASTVVGVVVALLIGASTATAASGTTGGYVAGSGYCWDDRDWGGTDKRILASSPSIDPAATSGIVGGGQVVGFRVTLQRWNDRYGTWAASQYSSLKTQTASWGFWSGEWYDHATGRQVNGLSQFSITTGGYYRLRYDYYWYTNGQVSGHDASLAWGLRDDRLSATTTTGWSYVDWCLY